MRSNDMENPDPAMRAAFIAGTAMSGLPIMEQLEFAKNLVFARGGDQNSEGADPTLVLAHHVLTGVTDFLRQHPNIASLRNE